MRTYHNKLVRLVLSAVLLAMAQVLPFLTGQIPQIGSMLCPMHIPVFLCGFFCGPIFGAVVGALAPIMRSIFFGMPPMFPTAFAMCFELATYGLVSGLMYRALKGSKVGVYFSLIVSMLAGRAVWGAVNAVLYGLGKTSYMLFESVVTNVLYYGVAFVLYLFGVWQPSLIGIALLFGIGNAFDSVVSFVAYAYLLRKRKINIFAVGR